MKKQPSRSTRHKLRVSFNHTNGEVAFQGLKHDEVDMLLKMLEGAGYVTGTARGTRVRFISRFEELPQVADKEMLPFWRRAETSAGTGPVQLRFPFMFENEGGRVGLYLHDLCGYRYTGQRYRIAAKLLEESGFHCLRSKRDRKKGTFREVWYLPDIEQAKDALARQLRSCTTMSGMLKNAIDFLQTHVDPKCIDVVRQ